VSVVASAIISARNTRADRRQAAVLEMANPPTELLRSLARSAERGPVRTPDRVNESAAD
jgi:hypothetical protein